MCICVYIYIYIYIYHYPPRQPPGLGRARRSAASLGSGAAPGSARERAGPLRKTCKQTN